MYTKHTQYTTTTTKQKQYQDIFMIKSSHQTHDQEYARISNEIDCLHGFCFQIVEVFGKKKNKSTIDNNKSTGERQLNSQDR